MYIVFDIGGTNMRFATSPDGVNLDTPSIVATSGSFSDAMQTFSEEYKKLALGKEITHVAGGITGAFNRERTILLHSPHLQSWIGNPIKETIASITKTPVYLDNDTAMVGLGEAIRGAGKGYEIVAYITVSTGVGGVRIVREKIDISTFNFEPGHQIIDADGSLCPDCVASEDSKSLGHWESYISGASLAARFGQPADSITDPEVWKKIELFTAYGLNNTIVHWAPDVVILGGGLMKNPGIDIDNVKEHLKNILKIYPVHPDIKKAELGDFGGLYGALYYLKDKISV